jgi:hypothetical protein
MAGWHGGKARMLDGMRLCEVFYLAEYSSIE